MTTNFLENSHNQHLFFYGKSLLGNSQYVHTKLEKSLINIKNYFVRFLGKRSAKYTLVSEILLLILQNLLVSTVSEEEEMLLKIVSNSKKGISYFHNCSFEIK